MPGLVAVRPFPASRETKCVDRSSGKGWEQKSRLLACKMAEIPSQCMQRCQFHPQNCDSKIARSKMEVNADENCASSGSEHDPSTVCLAAMVNEFMEDNNQHESGANKDSRGSRSCIGDEDDLSLEEIRTMLQDISSASNSLEKALLLDVQDGISLHQKEVEQFGSEDEDAHCAKRFLMKYLQNLGYNAAICKSRWEHIKGIPAGNYDYIDVIQDCGMGRTERFIIDMDFRSQFEVARPTKLYLANLQSLPMIFVGTTDKLLQILKIMCDAAKKSLKVKGLHLPPWRKLEYMKAKWFSCYRRTCNESPQTVRPYTTKAITWNSRATTDMVMHDCETSNRDSEITSKYRSSDKASRALGLGALFMDTSRQAMNHGDNARSDIFCGIGINKQAMVVG